MTTATLVIRDCPKCFSRPGEGCGIPVLVPHAEGGYTRHRQASVYTNADDRDCDWQRQDHADRVERLLSGKY